MKELDSETIVLSGSCLELGSGIVKGQGGQSTGANTINSPVTLTGAVTIPHHYNSHHPHPQVRVPERSQSFQEKRLALGSSKTSTVVVDSFTKSNSNLKVKHTRAQSFVGNTCNGNGQTNNNNISKNNLNTSNNGIVVSLCPDPTKTIPVKPCETIYENLEVIRANRGKASYGLTSRRDSTGSLQNGSNNNKASNMTIFEKDKDRRTPRKLTKDSGYETPSSYSDYMNIPAGSASETSPAARKESTTSPTKGNKLISSSQSMNLRDKDRTSGSKESRKGHEIYGNLSCNGTSRGGTTKPSPMKSSLRTNPTPGPPPTNENRKLRRSISEVPPERITLAKLQSKVVESSRTIYSSISNG